MKPANAILKYKVMRLAGASFQCVTMGDRYNFERTDSWSLSAWVRTTGTGVIISRMLTTGSFPGWSLSLSGGGSILYRIGFGSVVGQICQVTANGTEVNDGNWHHVAATYNGSSNTSGMTVYLDGTSRTLTVDTNNLASSIMNAAPCQIGARNSSGTSDPLASYLSADIQDVCVFGGVLTAGDVTALYGRGCPPNVLGLSLTRPLLSYWILGTHTGATGAITGGIPSGSNVPDLGTNAFSGTILNSAPQVTRL